MSLACEQGKKRRWATAVYLGGRGGYVAGLGPYCSEISILANFALFKLSRYGSSNLRTEPLIESHSQRLEIGLFVNSYPRIAKPSSTA